MESNLEVWKLTHQLVLDVYKISDKFPPSEQFGLTSKLRRSVASIPTNIVEGIARQYKKEFIQSLYVTEGSLDETNYHLYLAKDLGYISEFDYQELFEFCSRIKMMLHKLIKSFN
ncbi:MAG: four helix bundle protein [Flavobacterium sp.]